MRRRGLLIVSFVVLLAAGAVGQDRNPPGVIDEERRLDVAATENALYLVQVRTSSSIVFRRSPTGSFELRPTLHAQIGQMVATDDALYAVVSSGAWYALRGDTWTPELNLPDRSAPVSLLGVKRDVYAIASSPKAGALSARSDDPAATQPFDAGGAPLSLLHYGVRGWTGLAPLPPTAVADATPSLSPRLAHFDGTLHLFVRRADLTGIEIYAFDPATAIWSPAGSIETPTSLEGFWPVTFGGAVSVVMSSREMGAMKLTAVRWLPTGPNHWRPAMLVFSPPPEGVTPNLVQSAMGFNQHLALYCAADNGEMILQFGRLDAEPTEQTIVAREAFNRRRNELVTISWLPSLSLMIVFTIFIALFTFRRGAMAQTLPLPRDVEPALGLQRAIGLLIDLVPFLLIVGWFMGIDYRLAPRELVDTTFGADPTKPPAWKPLIWWTVSAGLAATYMLLAELTIGRTVGKLVAGMRLLSETGVPPTRGQILVRGLLRYVELLPTLWILWLMVPFSRNRQRVGDLFARTVVVRRVQATAPPPPREDPPSDTPGS